jgi:threonine aldolase
MLYFKNDYSCGAHKKVLEKLFLTNDEHLAAYGSDKYTLSAEEKIRAACGKPEASVFLISGGTQTNQVVISTCLESFEGVVSAVTGHVNAHEAGAIEYTGHKVLPLPSHEGKIDAGELKTYLADFYADESHEHMVFPGMVYISHPTEYGTIYKKKELEGIYSVCREYDIPLYIDGARLGYGLTCRESDMTLAELADLCDIFYIGGTKVGALCGEAVVFTNTNRKPPKLFLTQVKQRGAMLAKSRVLGVQFDALFTDGLYFDISRNAIDTAMLMKEMFASHGCRFYLDSPTNQQFLILENSLMEEWGKVVEFSFWEKFDDTHTVVRFATSWATTKEDVASLEAALFSK